jgi:hypothetical protein
MTRSDKGHTVANIILQPKSGSQDTFGPYLIPTSWFSVIHTHIPTVWGTLRKPPHGIFLKTFFILDPASRLGRGVSPARGSLPWFRISFLKPRGPWASPLGRLLGIWGLFPGRAPSEGANWFGLAVVLPPALHRWLGPERSWPFPVPCHTQVQSCQLLVLLWGKKYVWTELISPEKDLGPDLLLTETEGGQTNGSFPALSL